ncbi:hypothetical protein [Methanosarcina sp. 2.H.A.1B.4]
MFRFFFSYRFSTNTV